MPAGPVAIDGGKVSAAIGAGSGAFGVWVAKCNLAKVSPCPCGESVAVAGHVGAKPGCGFELVAFLGVGASATNFPAVVGVGGAVGKRSVRARGVATIKGGGRGVVGLHMVGVSGWLCFKGADCLAEGVKGSGKGAGGLLAGFAFDLLRLVSGAG